MNAIDLSDRRVLFVQSRAALDTARRLGLPADAAIYSTAPSLLVATDGQPAIARSLDNRLDSERAARIVEVPERLIKRLKDTLDLSDRGAIAHLCLNRPVLRTQALLRHAALLETGDFALPAAVVEVESDGPAGVPRNGEIWSQLLTGHEDFRVVRIESTTPQGVSRQAPSQPKRGFVQRLADRRVLIGRGTLERKVTEIGQRLWSSLAFDLRGSSFGVLSTNELVQETSYELLRRGYAVRRLTPASRIALEPAAPLDDTQLELIRSIAKDELRELVPTPACAAVIEMLLQAISREFRQFDGALPVWRRTFDQPMHRNLAAVLSNLPRYAADLACLEALTERQIPLVTCQHGVSREIGYAAETMRSTTENALSDLFLSFNVTCARIADSNPFKRAPGEVVGIPSAYWRTGTFRPRRRNAPPILYVSTAHYGAAQNVVRGAASDADIAIRERQIIDEVLGGLPRRVLFKPYPAVRYQDSDPVVEAARRHSNIEVFDGPADARYLLVDARFVVSARATSTMAWCLMADKPFFFLDHSDSSPLRPEARKLCEKALFVFDAASAEERRRLRKMLSLPAADVEAMWRERTTQRAELIRERFASHGPGAGKRAASLLLERFGK